MKKILKTILPLLLVVVILASIGWYCFIYDKDFTRDMMLQSARFFSSTGNQGVASWFYDLAYTFCAQDDDVAIELAEQYKDDGNFTKAEYTLTKAISDGGGASLYIALSKTYVEQDKLLDAVNMMDNITNPEIKSQLDAVRPAAPQPDTAPGYYSQYVTVALSQEDGTLYYNLEGEYPSTADAPYSEPITLPGGETIIYAVNVGDNGLVSPVTILGYTITGVIEPVEFADAAVEAEVRKILDLSDSETVYTDQLWTIREFTVPQDARDLSDLGRMAYLQKLTIQDVDFDNAEFLGSLKDLVELDLSGSRFPSAVLSLVGGMNKLQKLNMADCGLSTVSGIQGAVNLTELDVSNNTIRKLNALSGLTNLKVLNLQHNAVTKLDQLDALSALEKLDISYNSVESLSPLSSCIALNRLDASNNKLKNLEGLERLNVLQYLSVSVNDLTTLASISGNQALTELYVAENKLESLSALNDLTSIEVLDFAGNQVKDLPQWPTDCALRIIDGSFNRVDDLKALTDMENLSHIYMDYNEISSVSALKGCYKLMYISVYGGKVTGVQTLTDMGVIVNFDPTATSSTPTAPAESEE